MTICIICEREMDMNKKGFKNRITCGRKCARAYQRIQNRVRSNIKMLNKGIKK